MRERDAYNRDVTQAWNTIRLFVQTWNKRLPEYEDQLIYETPREKTKQTPKDLIAMLKASNVKVQPMSKESWEAIRRGPWNTPHKN